MKILSAKNSYAKWEYMVELEGDEVNRSDADLISACDNDGQWDRPACHFGGNVERRNGDPVFARVVVYID